MFTFGGETPNMKLEPRRLMRQALSVILTAAIVILAPGSGCYEAVAQVVRGQTGSTGAQAQIGVPALPSFSNSLTLSHTDAAATLLLAPLAPVSVPSVQAQSPAPRAQAAAASDVPAVPVAALATPVQIPALSAPVAAAPVTPAEVSARSLAQDTPGPLSMRNAASVEQLRAGGEKLSQAASDGEKQTALDWLFSRFRRPAVESDAASIAEGQGSALAPAASKIRLELQPTDAKNGGRAEQTPAAARGIPAAPAPGAAPVVNTKALIGDFIFRTFGVGTYYLSFMLAYPLIAIPLVGAPAYAALQALGSVAAVAFGPLSGKLAKKFSPRGAMVTAYAIQVALLLAVFGLGVFGLLNFWTLLLASIGNGWVMAAVQSVETTNYKRFSGPYIGTVNALSTINTFSLFTILGLILRTGSLVDYWQKIAPNLMLPFLSAALIVAGIVIPIAWKTLPNTKVDDAVAPTVAASQLGKAARALAFVKRYWKETVLFAAGLASFPFIHSTIPAIAALMFWVTRTDGFQAPRTHKPLLFGIIATGVLSFMLTPLQSYSLPMIASVLGGAAGKTLLLGKMMGALYFGHLLSSASQVQLPEVRLPLVGSVKAHHLVQIGVLGLLAACTFLTLVPGSALMAAAAVAAGAAWMALGSRITDRGWLRFVGIGLAGIGLPLFFWGNIPVLFASMLLVGLFLGPAGNAATAYTYKNIPDGQSANVCAARFSIINGSSALGYGIVSLLASMHKTPFPATLWPIWAIFLAAGLGFVFLPKLLPGLPGKVFKGKNEGK
jgi:hypothetical protein